MLTNKSNVNTQYEESINNRLFSTKISVFLKTKPAWLLVLVTLYLISVVLVLLLSHDSFNPIILTDELQYKLLGRNLINYHQIAIRGDFPYLIPPLYSIIVAIAQLLPTVLDTPLAPRSYLLNGLVMALAIFPAYSLARLLKFDRLPALLVGLIAIWLPNFFFVAHYMSEVLYYPLFVLVCYLGAYYFERSNWKTAFVLGIVLGLSLLTKSSATVVCLTWAMVNLGVIISYLVFSNKELADRAVRSNLFFRHLVWPGLSLLVAGLLYAPWVFLRSLKLGAGLLGGYKETVSNTIDIGILAQWWPIYLASLILSAGLIGLVPGVIAAVSLWQQPQKAATQRLQISFWITLILAITVQAASYSGASTNELRDRHMFYLIPLLVVLAAYGLNKSTQIKVIWLVFGSLLSGIVLSGILAFYDFHTDPLLNTPWIHGIGLILNLNKVQGADAFDTATFFIILGILLLIFSSIWLIKTKLRSLVFLILTLTMFVAIIQPVLGSFKYWAEANENDPQNGYGVFSNWLISTIGRDQRMYIIGHPFDNPLIPGTDTVPDTKLESWIDTFSVSDADIDYAEIEGDYDIRIFNQSADLADLIDPKFSNYLLSPVKFPNLHLARTYQFMYLYNLSDVPNNLNKQSKADLFRFEYVANLAPASFATQAAKLTNTNNKPELTINVTSYNTWLAASSPENLPAGQYKIQFCNRGLTADTVISYGIYQANPDNTNKTLIADKREIDAPEAEEQFSTLLLTAQPDISYKFAVLLNQGQAAFCGVQIEKLN